MLFLVPVFDLHGFINSVFQHSRDDNREMMCPPVRNEFTEHINPYFIGFFSNYILKASFGF